MILSFSFIVLYFSAHSIIALSVLCIQGSMEFHNEIYKLMIRLFEWKNVQPEMCLSILWESRRLTHALCVSPVNDALIMTSPGFSGEQFRSIDSWIHCLKGSPPLLVGFQHNFSYLFTNFHCDPDNHKPYKSDITVDDVKEAAFKLISSVRFPLGPKLPLSLIS
jgi:separase